MRGVITTRDVLANLGTVWREFGTLCVLRCLSSCFKREKTTFLEIACRK